MNWRQSHAVLTTAVVLGLLVAACAPASVAPSTSAPAAATTAASATPEPPVKANLKVQGYVGLNLSWLTQVAIEKGFFTRNGITAEFIPTATGAQAVAGLLSDSYQTSVCDPTICLPAVEKGEQLAVIAGQVGSLMSLVVHKDIPLPNLSKGFPDSFQDLKGKKIGVSAVGSITYYLMLASMKAAGMSADSIDLVPTGAPAESIAALTSKRVDGWIAYGPGRSQLLATGDAKVVLDYDHPGTNFDKFPTLKSLTGTPQGAIWAKKSWIAQNPKVVDQYRMALMQADVWMHDSKNLPEFLQLFKTKFGAPQGMDVNSYVIDNLSTAKSYFSTAGAQTWLDFSVEYGIIKKPIPVDQWVAPGTPQNEEEVRRLVAAAGGV
jgi:NitT/TauT family transport system substrate-binding protein